MVFTDKKPRDCSIHQSRFYSVLRKLQVNDSFCTITSHALKNQHVTSFSSSSQYSSIVCNGRIRMNKILNKIVSHLSITDNDNDRKLVRKPRHRYERPSGLHADRALSHSRSNQNAAESKEAMYSKVLSDMLRYHNYYREFHAAPPLSISRRLNYIAQQYAEYLAATSKFEHSGTKFGNEALGENLYMQWISQGRVPVSGRDATKSWYEEIELYDYKNPYYSEETGHFTQMVWKSSQRIGIGVALSANKREVYMVANYYPAGNIINPGYYEMNVLPQKR